MKSQDQQEQYLARKQERREKAAKDSKRKPVPTVKEALKDAEREKHIYGMPMTNSAMFNAALRLFRKMPKSRA